MSKEERMTPEEALAELQALKGEDEEREHARADDILCAVLRFYEEHQIVAEFERLTKWYA